MPKAMQFTKGSIIYFEGDNDDRIYILQRGVIVLTSTDIETGAQVVEQVKPGEFFGVKKLSVALNQSVREAICYGEQKEMYKISDDGEEILK